MKAPTPKISTFVIYDARCRRHAYKASVHLLPGTPALAAVMRRAFIRHWECPFPSTVAMQASIPATSLPFPPPPPSWGECTPFHRGRRHHRGHGTSIHYSTIKYTQLYVLSLNSPHILANHSCCQALLSRHFPPPKAIWSFLFKVGEKQKSGCNPAFCVCVYLSYERLEIITTP